MCNDDFSCKLMKVSLLIVSIQEKERTSKVDSGPLEIPKRSTFKMNQYELKSNLITRSISELEGSHALFGAENLTPTRT